MKMTVTLDVDVVNTTDESEAREAAFRLVSGLTVERKGRPASGPRATVTGIAVRVVEGGKFLTDSEAVEA